MPDWRVEVPSSPCCWRWTMRPAPWSNAVFCVSETAAGYFTLLEGLIEGSGIPLTLYIDHHAIFKHNVRKPETAAEATQFTRSLQELGIRQIFARPTTAQRPGGARGGNLPGSGGNRTALGRCSDHRPGHSSAVGFPAPLQRSIRRPAGASGTGLPCGGSQSLPLRYPVLQGHPPSGTGQHGEVQVVGPATAA